MPGHLPGALSPISAVARALWFLAWSVLAGAAAWARLFPGGRRLAPGTDEVVGRLWRRAMRLGWLWTAQATVLSLLVLLVAAVTSANSLPVTRETGIGWALLAAALVQLRRVTRRATAAQEPVEPRDSPPPSPSARSSPSRRGRAHPRPSGPSSRAPTWHRPVCGSGCSPC